MWCVSADTLDEKMKELYTFVCVMYSSTAIRPDSKEIRFDFSLMHCLTSVYFLQITLEYTPKEHIVPLLRSYLLTVVYLFISSGRPHLNLANVESYQSSDSQIKVPDWDDVLQKAIHLEDEHAVKSIRSLYEANLLYGHSVVFLNAAQMTIDHVKTVNDWYFSIGYDEIWQPHGVLHAVRDAALGGLDSLTGLSVETIQLIAFKTLEAVKDYPKKLISSE